MKKNIKFSIILSLAAGIFSVFIFTASASEGLLPEQKGKKPCEAGVANCGNYSLNDIVMIAVKISEFILGIVGSLSLLAFVAGGLMMMLSGGNAEMVTRGKQTIIGATIGLIIVFTSYTIIYFIFKSLGISQPANSNWFTAGWF